MQFRRAPLLGLAFLGSALALGGCTTASQAPVQVTRFHLGAPATTGRVTVEPADRSQAQGLEFQGYQRAVEAEIARLGFQVVENVPNSELVAAITVFDGTRYAAAGGQGSGVSVGLGGGGFSGGRRGGGIGLGGGVSFPIGGGNRSKLIETTELSVQLKRRSEGTVVWEGRARTEQRVGPKTDTTQIVARLASALFSGYPGESGRTIMVK